MNITNQKNRLCLLALGLGFLVAPPLAGQSDVVFSALKSVDFHWMDYLILCSILAFSGFMGGLTGFGFSALGAMSLWVLDAQEAIPLLIALSLFNQISSYQLFRRSTGAVQTSQAWLSKPHAFYVLGGFAGLPFGVYALSHLPAATLSLVIGAFLLCYALFATFVKSALLKGSISRQQALLVGIAGGVVGGFTAFPGSAVVVWTTLHGLDKVQQRSIIQPYILCMQTIALVLLMVQTDLITTAVMIKFLLLLPAVLPFTKLGVTAFHKVSDLNFKKVVLLMLMVSSVSLMMKSVI